MAKSKNHTNHNQIRKAHRNGILKPKTNYARTLRYRNPKMRKNQKAVTAGNMRVLREKKEAAKSS
ncbi:60S ribosomal protein L29 [Tulasnella sp. UAMH 9824]|nr:60S ribosomal protein L29 [Tulasnella sp. UAMH 9824]